MQTSEPKKARRGHKAWRVGVVDSISGDKTIRVVIENLVKHPFYGKYIRRRTRLMAHDPKAEARVGDQVRVAQCRPISKRKAWRLVGVVRRSGGV